MAIKIGTYTGNGAATQAIVGVGFQPKAVWIYSQVNAAWYEHAVKSAADAANCFFLNVIAGGSFMTMDDDIVSLDVGGFTVGDGSTWNPIFNINLQVYTYIAMR